MINLSEHSIHAWLEKEEIKTDTGSELDFKDHSFMWDIYKDLSPKQAIMKAAQVTMSTCATLKAFWIAKFKNVDIIYTLPTESDRNMFVGGKVNRIIAQNPPLQAWVKDKDSIEQKQVDNNFIHFRGTWTTRSAIMIPSDLNIYDEIDSSKQDVIEQYATRLQHSKRKWEWYFSHPSAPDFGVDRFWQKSDQKHWFIKCFTCQVDQYLSWPESIDRDKGIFVCKSCNAELSNDNRRKGRWVKKYKDREYSGYWIPLLICPWVSAKEIIGYHKNKSEEYFYNKVLGLPYVGAGNKLTWEMFAQNLTGKSYTAKQDERIVLGIDTGLKLDYVMGGQKGLFYHGNAKDYDELDRHMERWPDMIAVIDAGGDLIGSRKFYEKWSGRVFLCYLGADRKTKELVQWKEGDEWGSCTVDRYRIIQQLVGEFAQRMIPVHGDEKEWNDYYQHWRNLTRIKVMDPVTGETKGYKWVRSGPDHKASATWMWRVGMDKYGFGGGAIIGGESAEFGIPVVPEISPDMTISPVTPDGRDLATAINEWVREQEEDDY